MSLIEIILVGIGLSMDAFAVSVCRGLIIKKNLKYKAFIIALFFAIFQSFMPLIGFNVGVHFSDKITSIDHWIIFILLSLIGLNMIKESFEDVEDVIDELHLGNLIILSIATSIDALAIGVTFAFLEVDIYYAMSIIGLITFVLCFIGVRLGFLFGEKLKGKAEMLGGFILVIIGIKIIVEHIFF